MILFITEVGKSGFSACSPCRIPDCDPGPAWRFGLFMKPSTSDQRFFKAFYQKIKFIIADIQGRGDADGVPVAVIDDQAQI